MCCAAALLAYAGTVRGSEVFPDAVRQHWQVPNNVLPGGGPRGCRLCHNTDEGGLTDLNRYFGYRLKVVYGVTRRNIDRLKRGLDQVEARRDDSDGDRATDYEEVVEDATNPNDGRSHRSFEVVNQGGAGGDDGSGTEGGAEALPPEDYPPLEPLPQLPPQLGHGCSLGPARSRGSEAAWFVLALWLARRRRFSR
jgi:hypothetical protein